MANDERTPLIGTGTGDRTERCNRAEESNGASSETGKRKKGGIVLWLKQGFDIELRILLAAFFVTLSFTYTQVPTLYAFRFMVCDVFYQTHPPLDGDGDRCSRNEIAAGTATQFSILGISTSFCGTLNLFLVGWMVKRFGPRFTLIVQTAFPALRVATQILGLNAGGHAGIIIFQVTQLITVIGGPAGYVLVTNIVAGEVVEPSRRTSVFGRLQGCTMIGQSIGYLVSGFIGNTFGIQRPFDVALFSFLFSAAYIFISIPYIPPESMSGVKSIGKNKPRGLSAFLAPLKVLAPQKLRHTSGAIRNHYGVLFLCSGVFLGVLATGYAPILIQMYASSMFDFNQDDNGRLMSSFSLVRGIFLIFIFPQVISLGRKWFQRRFARKKMEEEGEEEGSSSGSERDTDSESRDDVLPTSPQQIEAPIVSQAVDEPVSAEPTHNPYYCAFDLFFLRWSLVLDGALTTICAYATQKWHIYLAAALLPFGSGSAPAGKGVITEMCPSSQRADALNALTLVENVARLSTRGLFGFLFATFASKGVAYLTFFCNAAIALLAMGVLLFSHFPAHGSVLIEEEPSHEEEGSHRVSRSED